MPLDKKTFLSGIAGKLAVLGGSAMLAIGPNALPAIAVVPAASTPIVAETSGSTTRTVAPKLVLRQWNEGFLTTASHDSHSSHSSSTY